MFINDHLWNLPGESKKSYIFKQIGTVWAKAMGLISHSLRFFKVLWMSTHVIFLISYFITQKAHLHICASEDYLRTTADLYMLVVFPIMTFNAVPNLGKKRQCEKHNKGGRNILYVLMPTVFFFYLNEQNINIKMLVVFRCEHRIITIYIQMIHTNLTTSKTHFHWMEKIYCLQQKEKLELEAEKAHSFLATS